MKTNINSSIIIESKRDKSFSYFLILFGGLFFAILSIFILYRERQEILSSTISLVEFLTFLFVCGLFPVYYILVVDKIIVQTNRVKINSYWGYKKNDIQIDDIISWNEINVKSKYGNFKKLIIRTNNFKYKIEQHYYDNYYELKSKIIKGKSEGQDTQEKYDIKANYFTILVTILFLILILTIYIFDKN